MRDILRAASQPFAPRNSGGMTIHRDKLLARSFGGADFLLTCATVFVSIVRKGNPVPRG